METPKLTALLNALSLLPDTPAAPLKGRGYKRVLLNLDKRNAENKAAWHLIETNASAHLTNDWVGRSAKYMRAVPACSPELAAAIKSAGF